MGAKRSRIRAAIGPTISGVNYELSPETVDQMAEINPRIPDFAIPHQGGASLDFDLPGFALSELERLGLPRPPAPPCTYASEEAYFSHRRFTHKGGKTGRQISIIAFVPPPADD
jgi:hypothetical protein